MKIFGPFFYAIIFKIQVNITGKEILKDVFSCAST
jgi:hypothetical protein